MTFRRNLFPQFSYSRGYLNNVIFKPKIFRRLQNDKEQSCNENDNQVIKHINNSDIIDCITKKTQQLFGCIPIGFPIFQIEFEKMTKFNVCKWGKYIQLYFNILDKIGLHQVLCR